MAQLEVRALEQDNLFHEGKKRYYLQIASKSKNVVINVGEGTFKKVLELVQNESDKSTKNEKDKLDK